MVTDLVAHPQEEVRVQASRLVAWQVVATMAVWAYVVGLHWHNDGLWYQGDAPVHAANGAFWMDFLRRLPGHPLTFALSYYARYPVINPTAYPPVFYLLEAALYPFLGVSPFVGKGLVLGFALLGGLYLVAWLRRWVAPQAGWAGILFLLQPGILTWGNAVMLNLPSAALLTASLYHWRRWLREPRSRQIYWAVAFALLATLTYTTAIVVVLLMATFALLEGRLSSLIDRRALALAGLCLVILLPWTFVLAKWAPAQREVGLYLGAFPFWKLESWVYYLKQMPRLATLPVLALAVVSLTVAVVSARWRKEVLVGASWFLVGYLWYSVFSVKEARYVLLLVPPLVLLCTIGVVSILQQLGPPARQASRLTVGAVVLLLGFHVVAAYHFAVPRVSGFKEIVAYLRQVAPDQWVFYDGYYSQLFCFYLRADDPGFHRGVVRASKLLYATKIEPRFGLVERVSSPADVVDRLQRECGCRYLVVERQSNSETKAGYYLQQALAGPDFRLVRTFRVQAPRVSDVDVYEYQGKLVVPESFDIPFPVLGEKVAPKIKPLEK